MQSDALRAGLDEIDLRSIALETKRDVRTVRAVARGGGRPNAVSTAEIRRAIAARLAAKGATP